MRATNLIKFFAFIGFTQSPHFVMANSCPRTIYNYSGSNWYVAADITTNTTFPNCQKWGNWCIIPPKLSELVPSTQEIDYVYADSPYEPEILITDNSDNQQRIMLNEYDSCPELSFYDEHYDTGSLALNTPGADGDITIRCNSWICNLNL